MLLVKERSTFATSAASIADSTKPPSYVSVVEVKDEKAPLPEDLSQRLQNLDLSLQPDSLPTTDRCIAHLKFLEALHTLRDSVASTEDLFGIPSAPGHVPGVLPDSSNADDKVTKLQAQVREKRWAVYVARAVDRFETWYTKCVPTSMGGVTGKPMNETRYFSGYVSVTAGVPIAKLDKDNMPPLDVLMVWHSYMLNPRLFLEDCLRHNKIDFYATPFPFEHISNSIDGVSFEYTASEESRNRFSVATGLTWDNLNAPQIKTMRCPCCWESGRLNNLTIPWTTAGKLDSDGAFGQGKGFADADFEHKCNRCLAKISHDFLRAAKFCQDLRDWRNHSQPMPGTLLSLRGLMEGKPGKYPSYPECWIPNLILTDSTRAKELEEASKPNQRTTNMDIVKKKLEDAISDRATLKRVGLAPIRISLFARVAIRQLLGRYWYNSSIFALDLVGAVIRQGTFVDKMHNIDWLHSPALPTTMSRLITKYDRFLTLMADNPNKMVVPTLDVDLAWHTHQLHPHAYYNDTTRRTGKVHVPKFLDHDDKIGEAQLSVAFAWTSRAYSKRWGEPYSHCTCWYCEAVRETHTSSVRRLTGRDAIFRPFGSSSSSASSEKEAEPCPSDPLKSAHISSHNAVRLTDKASVARARVEAAQLDRAYKKVCARNRKQGKREPERDEYYAGYAYGYPFVLPAYYVPYGADPCVADGAYVAPVGSVDGSAGAYGACAAGTCGSMGGGGAGVCGTGGAGMTMTGCGTGGDGGGCGGCGGCGGG